uniref:Putative secreted peptide n=1 Tax=Anopheles braziliensis TaxID=58242 RepID=A0A2M3ZXV2_9DIPT
MLVPLVSILFFRILSPPPTPREAAVGPGVCAYTSRVRKKGASIFITLTIIYRSKRNGERNGDLGWLAG